MLKHISAVVFMLMFVAAALLAQPPVNQNGVLDVNGGCVEVPDNPLLQITSQLTMEAWVQPIWIDGAYRPIIDKNYVSSYSFGTESAYPVLDSAYLFLLITSATRHWGPKIASNGTQWTHVAVTLDGSSGVITFYVNGQVATQINAGVFSIPQSTDVLRFGRAKPGDQYAGKIDEVRIWNVVRTQAQIADLMNEEAKGNEPGLVGVWHFEDPRSNIAYNRSVNAGLDGNVVSPAKLVYTDGPAAFQEEYEPNSYFEKAQFLSYGRVIATASLDLGDQDIYKFYAVPGDVIYLQTYRKNPGDHVSMQIEVIGSDSTTVLMSTAYEFPYLKCGCSAPGLHYVRITGYGTANPTGNYVMSSTLHGILPPDSREPNNTLPEATTIQFGDTLSAVMFPGIDVGVVPDKDVYRFDAQAGEIPLVYSFTNFPYGGGYSLHFLKSDGTEIPGGDTWVPHFTAPGSGTYYLSFMPSSGATPYGFGLFKGLEDVHRFLYDPCGLQSALVNGTYDAYDGAYYLYVNGTLLTSFPDYSLSELSGRQFVTKPQTISGLTVRRKFLVPDAASGDTLGFIRFQEILQNNTAARITATIGIRSDLGSDYWTHILYSSSGDTLLTKDDFWVITDDNKSENGGIDNDPTLTHIFDGFGGADRVDSVSLSADNLYWEWRNVVINPGETKIYMYYAAQDTNYAWALRKGMAFSSGKFPAGALVGLEKDQSKIQNWSGHIVGVGEDLASLPKAYALEQNFPNPFNPITRLSYGLPRESRVKLSIFNTLGQAVSVLVDGVQSAGKYSLDFDGSCLASGVYFYRIYAESLDGRQDFSSVQKMLLLK